jgi:hypothetical protein
MSQLQHTLQQPQRFMLLDIISYLPVVGKQAEDNILIVGDRSLMDLHYL